MGKIRVVKPFTFSKPHVPGDKEGDPPKKMASERKFDVGVHDVDDDVVAHPWIRAGADGCIADPKTAGTIEAARQAVSDAEAELAQAKASLAAIEKEAADKAATGKPVADKPTAAAGPAKSA